MNKEKRSSKKDCTISDSTKEELWLSIANLAAGEEHILEVCSKSSNKELKKDLRIVGNEIRKIRQDCVTSGCFR